MILSNLSQYYNNVRFSAVNKLLEKKKKSISRKYVGLYGIHSVAASGSNQTLKVFAHSVNDVPEKVKRKIINMSGKYRVIFMDSKTKNPQDYHMEEIFKSNTRNE